MPLLWQLVAMLYKKRARSQSRANLLKSTTSDSLNLVGVPAYSLPYQRNVLVPCEETDKSQNLDYFLRVVEWD